MTCSLRPPLRATCIGGLAPHEATSHPAAAVLTFTSALVLWFDFHARWSPAAEKSARPKWTWKGRASRLEGRQPSVLGRPPSTPRNQRPPQGSHLSWSEGQRDECPAGSQVETGLGPAQRHAWLAYDLASPLLAGVHSVMSPQPDPDALSPHPLRAGSFMPLFILHTRSLRVSWELVTREEGHPGVPLAAAPLPLYCRWPS